MNGFVRLCARLGASCSIRTAAPTDPMPTHTHTYTHTLSLSHGSTYTGEDGIELTLTRRLVRVPDVKLTSFLGPPADGIGYIQLSSFSQVRKGGRCGD